MYTAQFDCRLKKQNKKSNGDSLKILWKESTPPPHPPEKKGGNERHSLCNFQKMTADMEYTCTQTVTTAFPLFSPTHPFPYFINQKGLVWWWWWWWLWCAPPSHCPGRKGAMLAGSGHSSPKSSAECYSTAIQIKMWRKKGSDGTLESCAHHESSFSVLPHILYQIIRLLVVY